MGVPRDITQLERDDEKLEKTESGKDGAPSQKPEKEALETEIVDLKHASPKILQQKLGEIAK